jgi:F0F1-type ATP synthase assembly protein I
MSSLGLFRLAALAVALATVLGADVAIAAYVGFLLDQRWGTDPWLALLGAFGGLIGGILTLLAVLKRVPAGGPDGT